MGTTGKLTPRQERFVAEYIVDLNATRAAIRAGYSQKTARVIGPENLSKPAVKAAIEKARAKVTAKAELTAERVLLELKRLVTFDPSTLFDETGRLLPIRDMPKAARQVLAGFEEEALFDTVVVGEGPRGGVQKERVQVGVVRKLKWASKIDAVRLAMQRFGLVEPEDGKKPVSVSISINGIRQEAQAS